MRQLISVILLLAAVTAGPAIFKAHTAETVIVIGIGAVILGSIRWLK
jgi:hypothetical protein